MVSTIPLTCPYSLHRDTRKSPFYLLLRTSGPYTYILGNVVCHNPNFDVRAGPFEPARIADIESVTVASHPAEFVQYDPVANMNVSDPTDFHIYPEVKRRFYSALAEGDEGELAIHIPHQVAIKQVRVFSDVCVLLS